MKINVKNLVTYIFIMIVSVLFMLFLDGPGGTYLIVATSAALLLSAGIFIWTRAMLTYSLRLSEDVLNKGDVLSVELILRKQGFLPTSIIRFAFSDCPFLYTETKEVNTVVIFGHDEEIVGKSFKAAFFGSGRTGVEKIVVSDYLGIFYYRGQRDSNNNCSNDCTQNSCCLNTLLSLFRLKFLSFSFSTSSAL